MKRVKAEAERVNGFLVSRTKANVRVGELVTIDISTDEAKILVEGRVVAIDDDFVLLAQLQGRR